MTPAARLQAAIDLLDTVFSGRRPADVVAGDYFRARRFIGSKDRAAVAETVYSAIRHHARLRWWIKKLGVKESSARIAILAHAVLVNGEAPDSIAGLFAGGKYAPPPLEKEEKQLLSHLEGHTLFHPEMPEAVALECPHWAEDSLRQRFGDQFKPEMAALLEAAPLDLRVNTLKTTRDNVFDELREEKLAATKCALSPMGIRLAKHISLGGHALFRGGAIEVQDEGSQIIALLVDARPGMRVLDLCAGAGGKTLALAAAMNNKGRIIACDTHDKRLARTTGRLRRAGVHNVMLHALESAHDEWLRRHAGGFERVLIDAPCSGSGTWRRNPDARWREPKPDLESLAAEQQTLLGQGAKLTAAGGVLVYATCSLFAQENEDRIEAFLKTHPSFTVVPVETVLPSLKGQTGAYLSLSPLRHGTDGFFAAVMKREK